MGKDTVVWIEVPNWAKYNPRADRGGFSWFRMDNQFYLHMRQRKGLSADATVLMSFCLCECSAHQGEGFKLRIGFAAEMLGRTVSQLEKAIEQLVSHGEISLKPLEAASTLTDGRTDGHVDDECVFDFESLYKLYPRRKGDQGKTAGIKKCERDFSSKEKFELLKLAIQNYATHCNTEKLTGTTYVKQFRTFVSGSWDEWVSQPGSQPVVLKSAEEFLDA